MSSKGWWNRAILSFINENFTAEIIAPILKRLVAEGVGLGHYCHQELELHKLLKRN
jgi:hypothetical protein